MDTDIAKLLSGLLAPPMVPSIRVHLDPVTVIEIDRAAFDRDKDELVEFCRSLPEANEGASWRALKLHTNNGMLAKLLIALGELTGVWKMHPSPAYPELWGGNRMYPMVLADSVTKAPSASRMPKPSAGDLEVGVERCARCGKDVPPPGSMVHDPVECSEEDCPMDGAVKVPKPKPAPKPLVKQAEDEEDEYDDMLDPETEAAFMEFARQFEVD